MPYRKIPIATDYIYHVFNRSTGQIPIFLDSWDYRRFTKTAAYYQGAEKKIKFSHPLRPKITKDQSEITRKRVEILAYCIMPNHFHFMLKQLVDGGIAKFLADLSNSYSKYFNTKYHRNGHLFGGPYKAVLVETDEQLIHLSRYIHLNPIASHVVKKLKDHPWSSYFEYINDDKEKISSPDIVLGLLGSQTNYEQFVQDQVSYAKELEKIKHLSIDSE